MVVSSSRGCGYWKCGQCGKVFNYIGEREFKTKERLHKKLYKCTSVTPDGPSVSFGREFDSYDMPDFHKKRVEELKTMYKKEIKE